MKNKIIIGAIIVVAIALGIVMAHAQVNPQDQVNAITDQINDYQTELLKTQQEAASDSSDLQDKIAIINKIQYKLSVAQYSLNEVEYQISQQSNAISNAQDNCQSNLDVQGTVNPVGT